MKRGPGPKALKPQRTARRQRQRVTDRTKEEQNRRRATGGGQPNELGVLQGQNAEQGNTTEPRNARSADRPAH